MNWPHVSDHDLERYYLGMVTAEQDLAPLEEHILYCRNCAERAKATQDYVDAMRIAILRELDQPICGGGVGSDDNGGGYGLLR
jgi:hypothetical protein